MRPELVRDIMSTDLVTLQEDEDLDLAHTVMQLGRIRHLPVVRGAALVGLVTHRDILRAQVSSVAEVSPSERQAVARSITASQIMSRDVTTVSPQTPLIDAARLIKEQRFGCLPVVGDGGELVGLLTEADFLDLLIRVLELGT